jgi:shikimate dehydrogenase
MKLYGLVGYPLGHSFSKKYFTDKFKKAALENVAYENFETTSLADLKNILGNDERLKGLNVTIPYKSQIIAYLDECDPVVTKLNACNCINISNGRWIGYNTDVVGFKKSFTKKLQPHHTHALIMGTGGSSKAVEYVLQELGISYLLVSREKKASNIIQYDHIDSALLEKYSVIINTTPTGMYPNVEEYPKLKYELITPRHYLFDLIYNPLKTIFLQRGEEKGAITENGYEMLVEQAEESWRIWNAKE